MNEKKLALLKEFARKSETQETVQGVVEAAVKGGLKVDLGGLRAFLPASLATTTTGSKRNLDRYIGQTFSLLIIKVEERGNIVVGRTEECLLEELNSLGVKTVKIEELSEGAIFTGIVKNVCDYAIWVDFGCVIDGMMHVSSMGGATPRALFKKRDIIDVKVIKFDSENNRLSLGMVQK